MDRKQGRGSLRHRGRHRIGIDVERDGVDVGKDGARPFVQRDVRAGHERERAGNDLVAFADAGGPQSQMQPSGAARESAGVTRPHAPGERLLKFAEQRPQRQPARTKRGQHPRLLLGADHRPGERKRLF